MPYNRTEKFVALVKSPDIRIWDFTYPKPKYCYWFPVAEPGTEPTGTFDSLEEMIDAAYAHIDPLAGGLDESSEH